MFEASVYLGLHCVHGQPWGVLHVYGALRELYLQLPGVPTGGTLQLFPVPGYSHKQMDWEPAMLLPPVSNEQKDV